MSQDSATQPQEAFTELARITLADHSLSTVMDRVVELTKRTIPGAAEVSITFVQREEATTTACTGDLALRLDERQYDKGYGPCLACIDGGEPIQIKDTATETRWPDWSKEAQQQGAGSTLSIPIPVQREVSAALNIYGTVPNAFDSDAVELASTFAAYAGVALANMHLYEAQGQVAEQLQTAMASRAVIEQAKGILMATRHCGSEEAFDVLVRLSQHSNRKLREVAQALVDQASTAGDA